MEEIEVMRFEMVIGDCDNNDQNRIEQILRSAVKNADHYFRALRIYYDSRNNIGIENMQSFLDKKAGEYILNDADHKRTDDNFICCWSVSEGSDGIIHVCLSNDWDTAVFISYRYEDTGSFNDLVLRCILKVSDDVCKNVQTEKRMTKFGWTYKGNDFWNCF
jgi:hypothetical protein